jgi:hypothetical protein
MELPARSLHWELRTPDWVAAGVSGFAAGALLMVLDLLWSSVVDFGGPWRTSHMIAPILLGGDVGASTGYSFSVGIVALSLAVHYVLGIVFGLALAVVMAPLHLDATVGRALATGAVFGLILYLVNFFGMVLWFPWLAELRGWATVAAHLVFGMTAAVLYWKLERRGPAKEHRP